MVSALKSDVLAGKVALVAGASTGINYEIARQYGLHGAKVAILSRKPDKIFAAVDALKAEAIDVIGFPCDVRDYGRLEEVYRDTVEAFGKIDIVLSGAAGNFLAPSLGMSANAFKTVIDIDLLGTFNVFRASFEHLNKPGASLITITAGQAVRPMMFQIHACAAKAGVNMVTKCLALEWGPAGVRVNAISPGPIADTEGMARLAPDDQAESTIKGRIALRDYGTKGDIAEMALFLATDSARYITGSIINVDGGSELGDAAMNAIPEGF